MPPRQTITKDVIAQAAFNLVRNKGIAALSARSIATSLSCSTQPVYSCFNTMKDLEKTVIDMVLDFIFKTYLTGNDFSNDPFFSMGLGYIQLAKKDPHLFDLIYLSDHTQKLFGKDVYPKKKALLVQTMQKDPVLNHLGKDVLTDLLGHMWIYTHGLAMLARVNPDLGDRIIHDRLHEMGHTLISGTLQENEIETK